MPNVFWLLFFCEKLLLINKKSHKFHISNLLMIIKYPIVVW
jgi:hypothetical protein